MITRMRLGLFVSLTIVFASACSSRVVRHVAGSNDSLVVNNRLSILLPVYGVDARGRRHMSAGLRYQRIAGDSIALTPDGRVTCSRRADARVSVSHELLTTTFSLLCRPILAVDVKRIRVLAGADSAALDPYAIGMNGEHERLISGVAVVQDTSIVYVDHGMVFGRLAGERTSSSTRATAATGHGSKSTSGLRHLLALRPFKSSSAARWSSPRGNCGRGGSRLDPTTSGPATTQSVGSRSARRTSTAPPESARASTYALPSRMEPSSCVTCDEGGRLAVPCS